jgi:probable rRNA maturation factor
MAELNARFRGKAGPTNVLSFSQLEGESISLPNGNLLGDVVICTDVAASDAERLGYSLEEMMVYLLIHGILHIVGYSHDSATQLSSMESEVERIFQKIFPEAGEIVT